MKKIIILFTALLPFITSCTKDDSDFDTLLILADQAIKPIDIDLDYSALEEAPDEVITDPDDPYYNDYVENESILRTVYIHYEGETVTLDGATNRVSINANGTHVVVNSSAGHVDYVLSGTTDNGSFKIYSDSKFKLTLNGVSITNPTGAAINDQCGKTVYLVLTDGTTNTLTDGAIYSTTSGEQMKGAFFSEGQVIVSGTGTLNVNATGGHGFVSDDYIRFRPGCKLNVTSSAGHGIKANDGVFIDGGVLNITITGDGYKGIKSDLDVDVKGGRTTVITSGNSRIVEESLETLADTSSCAGIKCEGIMTVSGGTLNMKSTGEGGKGLNTVGDLVITGGNINVVTTGIKGFSSPKGIKSDADINISGGNTYSYSKSSDPIDAQGTLTVAEGYTTRETLSRRVKIFY
ncbi:MAG: carbohydrate-binding domain-containing protein [Muribaculaceae bacterium]|nr:carbohydrate-binding domain-containing protein [Muribaculaceae bacterium]